MSATLPERLKALASKGECCGAEILLESGPMCCGKPVPSILANEADARDFGIECFNALPELLAALEDQARYRWLAADGDRARKVLNENSGLDVEAAIDAGLDAARPTACATKGDGNGN